MLGYKKEDRLDDAKMCDLYVNFWPLKYLSDPINVLRTQSSVISATCINSKESNLVFLTKEVKQS